MHLQEKVNAEGLTWSEWAYAAGVREPVMHGVWDAYTSHWVPGYAYLFRKERRAWRKGEDPTEWRA